LITVVEMRQLGCKAIAAELAPDWHQQDSESNKSVFAIVKTPANLVGRVGIEPTTKGL
jgi:hypothetical protein